MFFGRIVPLLALLALVAGPGGLVAQGSGDNSPAIVVELKFSGETIEVVGKTDKEAFVPKQNGVPQMAPLWYEALGSNGEVVYADVLPDPRELRIDSGDPAAPDATGETDGAAAKNPGTTVQLEEANLSIAIPAGGRRPKDLVVYRRSSENSESGRTELLRVGL